MVFVEWLIHEAGVLYVWVKLTLTFVLVAFAFKDFHTFDHE